MFNHYDPNQPRNAEGEWTDAGDAIRKAASDNKSEKQFTSYADAQKWMEEEAKKYKSKNEFYASGEYKEAYPKIRELYDLENNAEKTQNIIVAKKAMHEASVKYGDRVLYDNINPFGYIESYSGTLIEKNGAPKEKLDEGQKTISGQKILRWHKGWQKTVI